MTLHVAHWGTGTVPTVFLHGFTLDHRAWDFMRPLLGDTVSASAVDLPGHGGSNATRCSSFDNVIDNVARVSPPRAWLVGYSQGARVALAYAARFPSRVSGLILVSGSPGLADARERERRVVADAAWTTLLRTVGMSAFVPAWEAQPILQEPHAVPAQRQLLHDLRMSQDAEGLAHALEVMGQGAQPPCWDALRGMDVDVHLVTGADDARYNAIADAMARDLPGANRVVLRGGHSPHVVSPSETAALIRTALSRSTHGVPG